MRRILASLALLLAVAAPAFAVVDTTFVTATGDGTDGSVHTFADHAIGPAAADRCVDVFMHTGRSLATEITVTVTIGGNAASVIYQKYAQNGSISRYAGLATLLVPSGTTATIVTTANASVNRMVIAVFTRTGTGGDCTTMADSDFSEATDPSVALDVPANGSAYGACTDVNTTTTWVGLTEVYDGAVEAIMTMTGAADDFVAAQTGLTITCNLASAGDSAEIGIFASFAPAAVAAGAPRGSFNLMGVGK